MLKIKIIREKQGLSQEQLAEKSGVSRTVISFLENKEDYVTTTSTLQKISDVLNCNVSDFF